MAAQSESGAQGTPSAGRDAGTSSSPATTDPREDLPWGIRLSAAWAWRLGAIVLVTGGVVWMLSSISFLLIPLFIATLLAALLRPVVTWFTAHRWPRGLAVATTELGLIALIVAALALVGQQLAKGFPAMWKQALAGIEEVQDWLTTGPLQLSDLQISTYVQDATKSLNQNSGSVLAGALKFGGTAGHLAAGTLLTLFILIFFLLEGERIWTFLVGMMPRRARPATDGAGRRVWTALAGYTHVQVLVAAVNAVGIGVGAAVLGVPLALPLGVLVFLGSFIPIVGALVTGAVAVLLALVSGTLVHALVMLAVVLLVHLAESHLLQPLVMGRAVALHPVAVILAVAAGSTLAGIPGAVFAVPALAAANAAIRSIAGRTLENGARRPMDRRDG